MYLPLANLLGLDPGNWLLIALVALLLFGKRLPEVGKSLGKGIVEFKKGLAGIEEEINQSSQANNTPAATARPTLPQPPSSGILPGMKFDPYTGKPLEQPQMRFDPYTGKPLTESAEAESAASSSSQA